MNSGKSKSLRIFHLEDDSFDAELLAIHLKSLNRPFVLRTIATEDEWNAALRIESPDLIISDSRIVGLEAARAIEYAKSCSPAIPVIVFSGHLDPQVRLRAGAAGAVAFIDKNDAGGLIETIHNLLGDGSPPMETPVLVQCDGFRCLGCWTRERRWVDSVNRKPLPPVLSWWRI